jgi:hypothetical protein
VTVGACASSISVETEPGALVALFDTSYYPLVPLLNRPSASDSAITDRQGRARFDNLPPGGYNIFVFDSTLLRGVLIGPLSAGALEDTLTLSDSLHELGRLAGSVSDKNTSFSRLSVYLKGTPFGVLVDTLGRFAMGPLPAGNYQFTTRQLFLSTAPRDDEPDSLELVDFIRPPSTVFVTVESGRTTTLDR